MLTGLIVCVFLASTARADFVLVRDGQPRAVIVVTKTALTAAPDPKPDALVLPQPGANKIAAAARDLQEYVAKISGARLPMVGDDDKPSGPVILVGKSAMTGPFNSKIPSGLTPVRDEEGLSIISQDNRLVLAGNDEGPYHGTEYAVAELLHRLGVRWYVPGDYDNVVPAIKTLVVPEGEVRQKPDFKMRNWMGSGPSANQLREYRWKIRNKMNPAVHLVSVPQDNSAVSYLPPDTEKIAPEALALGLDGKRVKTLPNLTHPKAVEVVSREMLRLFRKDPALTSVGIAPDDGIPRDWDPASVKRNLGFPELTGQFAVPAEVSVTEEWIDFINRVAREVHKEFPNHIITTNGYANRNTPPLGIKVEKNVWIMFAAIWSDTLHAYDDPRSWQTFRQGQMIQRWCELCPNVFMYDYAHAMLASAGTALPLGRKHCRDMPLLKKWGVIGFLDECRTVLAESGVYPRYLRARMMWDANLNAETATAEFFTNWYGPAAKPARSFWDALEKAIEDTPLLGHEDRIMPYVYTPALLLELESHATEAEKLAVGDLVKMHVRVDRLILEHLKSYLAMTKAEWAADFSAAVRHADAMLARRKELNAISPFFFMPDDKTQESGFYYWGVNARRDYYQKWADMTTGKTGDMVVILDETTPFRTDPRDEGRFSGWFDSNFAAKDWKPVRTTRPFYLQGYLDDASHLTYMGPLWYRFKVNVPASAKGKKVMLYIPTIETEAHVWVNGQFVAHKPHQDAYERPNDLNADVTAALAAERLNTIVVRAQTGTNAASQPSGLISRAFLYAPK